MANATGKTGSKAAAKKAETGLRTGLTLEQLLNPPALDDAAQLRIAAAQAARATRAQQLEAGEISYSASIPRRQVVLPDEVFDAGYLTSPLSDPLAGKLSTIGARFLSRSPRYGTLLYLGEEKSPLKKAGIALYWTSWFSRPEDAETATHSEVPAFFTYPDAFKFAAMIQGGAGNWAMAHQPQLVAWEPGDVDANGRGRGYTFLKKWDEGYADSTGNPLPFDPGMQDAQGAAVPPGIFRIFTQSPLYDGLCGHLRPGSAAAQVLRQYFGDHMPGEGEEPQAEFVWFVGKTVRVRSGQSMNARGAAQYAVRRVLQVDYSSHSDDEAIAKFLDAPNGLKAFCDHRHDMRLLRKQAADQGIDLAARRSRAGNSVAATRTGDEFEYGE